MDGIRVVACAVLLLCPLALTRVDDDFAFDNGDEFQLELTSNHSEIAKNSLRRLWGVPDTSAYVGHLFRMEIPKEAFSGEVVNYKVRSEDGRRAPSWLAVDSRHGLISGIPQQTDVGAHTFTVTAHGRTHGLTATDSFSIEVKKASEKPHSKYGSCRGGESRLVLVILIDNAFNQIASRQRIRALMELASFMALDGDEFWMEPYKPESAQWQSVLMSGPGTTQRKRGDATTAIYLNVGCGEKLWARHKVLIAGLREQARDGTLANTLRLPVLGWRLTAVKPAPRPKRQSPLDDGSGTYDTYGDDDDADAGDYSGYDDDDDDYTRAGVGNDDNMDALQPVDPPLDPRTPLTPAPVPTDPPTSPTTSHPHRHHHGDYSDPTTILLQSEGAIQPITTVITSTVPTTSTTTPPLPSQHPTEPPTPPATEELITAEDTTPASATSTNSYITEEHKVQITPYSESASAASNVNFSHIAAPNSPRKFGHSPVVIVPEDLPTTNEPDMQTVIIRASNEIPVTSSIDPHTAPSPSPTVTTDTVTSQETATVQLTVPSTPMTVPTTIMTSPLPSPTTPTSTVYIPPTVPTTVETTTEIPESTIEEVTEQETMSTTERSSTIIGRTTETVTFAMPVNQPPSLKHHMKKYGITAGKAFRYIIPADLFIDPEEGNNLTLTMYESDNKRLRPDSWVQFLPKEREVYGLPLESHVSRWNFIVEARDSEGLTARGPLDITVQQYKGGRTINHQFILKFKLNRPYSNEIDWQIRALEGLVNLFRDTDMDQIIVLNSTRNGDICEFVWTNDTLPKDSACPMEDIKRLMTIMESEDEPSSPSAGLVRAMSPELKVFNVSWRGVGRCATPTPPTLDSSPPVPRNPIDHLTATVGHLLVYKVPEDTFFDAEDGTTRDLQLSLRYDDLSEIPAGHWLQFDEANQEFFGLPTSNDEGSVHCQLIAQDKSKKSAHDSLVVEVLKAPTIKAPVQFMMILDDEGKGALAYNSYQKRILVENIAELFGQPRTDTRNIRIQSISGDPTTIVWYNTSLPMDRCPSQEIEYLRNMIIIDDKSGSNLKDRVDAVIGQKINTKVMSITLIPMNLCGDQNTKTPKVVAPKFPPKYTPTNSETSKAGAAAPTNGYTEYLVTFIIPAIVIVCMILVAGIIACVLYKRRRTGKMSVGDEEEREAFRSKGIPVIFQDELEERGDSEPVHKSPVIMREEKPPLLPPTPDYRSGEDAPYRPPPPFAASRTPPRPKATPTYRKPPPYVPP